MRRLLLAASALVSASYTLPAHAQSAGEELTDDEAIVVTARKRQENIIDVPLAISVATQAQLQRDQINSLNDLQRIAPALEISQTAGGESNGGARMRGLGTGVFNPSVASSVAFVVDQVPMGNMSFPQLFDLAQIEVLRGPQGTLFGQGASAGVINVSTRAPDTDALGANASIEFADKGSVGSEVGELIINSGVNIPVSDKAAFRVAAQYKRETGLQRSTTTGDNRQTDYGFRVKALLMPSETFTVNIAAEYGESIQDGQNFFALAVAPNSAVIFDPPGPPPPGALGTLSTAAYTAAAGCAMPVISQRAEYYCEGTPSFIALTIGGLSAVVDWELSDNVTLTSVTGYKERAFKQHTRDFSRLSTAASARQERTQEDSRTFTQELRLSYEGEGFDVVVGSYYGDYRFDRVPIGAGPFTFGSNLLGQRIGFSVCPTTGIGFCPVATSFTKETTENHNTALFADATVELSEVFNIFGGLRYSDYSNTTAVQIFGTTTGARQVFVTKDSDLSGRIGLSFKPNSDTNLYASYSRGYKPPAVGTTAAGALFQLDPEKADAFELGAKFGIGRFQLAANAFYNTLKNFQSQTSVFVGTALISVPLNIPEVKSKGFELTAMGQIAPGLSINGGYQFNDITFPAGYLGDDGGNLGGTQFLFAPKHKFTLSGEYAIEVGGDMEVFLNANLIYKSKTLLAARADPRYRYPAHELINLGFGFRDIDGAWNASIFVRNLTKEREPTAYLASTFFGVADGGIRAWPVSGLTARVVGVRAGFSF
jgi:iron complex outermembrane recepter protein